jgi:hypothetical protein
MAGAGAGAGAGACPTLDSSLPTCDNGWTLSFSMDRLSNIVFGLVRFLSINKKSAVCLSRSKERDEWICCYINLGSLYLGILDLLKHVLLLERNGWKDL